MVFVITKTMIGLVTSLFLYVYKFDKDLNTVHDLFVVVIMTSVYVKKVILIIFSVLVLSLQESLGLTSKMLCDYA